MKIRATKKVLNISRIKAVPNLEDLTQDFPGEWYVNIIPSGIPRKQVLHFLHSPSMVSVLVQGKSIKKSLPQFFDSLRHLLKRHGFEEFLDKMDLTSEVNIFTTNSKKLLANMNQMRYVLEYHDWPDFDVSDEELAKIEDFLIDYLFSVSSNKKYNTSTDILSEWNESPNKTISKL
jgi:hypothetical protein